MMQPNPRLGLGQHCLTISRSLPSSCSDITMADSSYLAVLKAAYDYAPQGDDEVAVKEDQLLFLLERTDDECVLTSR
jgi:hypothetical protein